MRFWRRLDDGIVVAVRLTPRADRDGIEGIGEGADGRAVLRARVCAVPEDGAANQALAKLLAKAFGRPKSSVTMVSGGKQRIKQVKIAGDPGALAAIAEALL